MPLQKDEIKTIEWKYEDILNKNNLPVFDVSNVEDKPQPPSNNFEMSMAHVLNASFQLKILEESNKIERQKERFQAKSPFGKLKNIKQGLKTDEKLIGRFETDDEPLLSP